MSVLPLSLSSIWPEGLESLTGSVFLDGESNRRFTSQQLVDSLTREGIVFAQAAGGLSAPIQGAEQHSGFRGALKVSLFEAEWTFHWTISPSADPWADIPAGQRAIGIDELSRVLSPFILERNEPAVARGYFRLPTERWKSTVTLPVRLPGILEGLKGKPEISGFKFRFTDPPSELRTAEVQVGATDENLRVELMVVLSFFPEEDLIHRLCGLLSQHIGLFAVRAPTEVSTDGGL